MSDSCQTPVKSDRYHNFMEKLRPLKHVEEEHRVGRPIKLRKGRDRWEYYTRTNLIEVVPKNLFHRLLINMLVLEQR